MSLLDSPAISSELAEKVLAKLQNAPAPLPVMGAAKGLPKGRRVKAADFQNEVRTTLEELVRLGQVFRCQSGKGGQDRYWTRDEKHLLRSQAVELASTPLTLATLKKELAKHVKGVDGSFVESVIRELVREDKLFEHPPKTKKGGPLFAAFPPPPPTPPLSQSKHKRALDGLVKNCRKLLAAAGVPLEELMRTLTTHLKETIRDETADGVSTPPPMNATEPVLPPMSASSELEELLLKAVADTPVLSLAELRGAMPVEYRGRLFDDAVLKLADARQVIIHQDAEPSRFSPAEQSQYVRDGDALFTTIAQWR